MAQLWAQLLAGIPPVTRTLLAITLGLMALTSLDLVSQYTLLFSANKILAHGEIWRLVTSMLFFGDLGVQFCYSFYMMCGHLSLIRMTYCSRLEVENFESRRLDFAWCLVLIFLLIGACASVFPRNLFLSGALLSALTYIWGRKNPNARLTIVFFAVDAPYIAWVLIGVSWIAGYPVLDHLIGIFVGHSIFFLDDIFPLMPVSKGFRLLAPPRVL